MSRSSKSIWKIPYIHPIFWNKSSQSRLEIKTNMRKTTIPASFEGKTITIYNGRKYEPFLMKEEMKGFKLGDFSFTKIIGINRGKKKGKKKKR